MTTLRKLQAAAADEPAPERGFHHQAGVDLGEGRFRAVRLGAAGLTVIDGLNEIAIPMEELLALAEPHLAGLQKGKK